jgi:hypothetical protein
VTSDESKSIWSPWSPPLTLGRSTNWPDGLKCWPLALDGMSSTLNDGVATYAVCFKLWEPIWSPDTYSSKGKPARETQFDIASWLHLPQPKLNIYVSRSSAPVYTSKLNDSYFADPPSLWGRWRPVPRANRESNGNDENAKWASSSTRTPFTVASRCELFSDVRKLRQLP